MVLLLQLSFNPKKPCQLSGVSSPSPPAVRSIFEKVVLNIHAISRDKEGEVL
jgi:hypothetical protein